MRLAKTLDPKLCKTHLRCRPVLGVGQVDAARRHLLRVLRRLLVQPDVACSSRQSGMGDMPLTLSAPCRGQYVGTEAGGHTGLWRGCKAHGWSGKRSARVLTALYPLADGSGAIHWTLITLII